MRLADVPGSRSCQATGDLPYPQDGQHADDLMGTGSHRHRRGLDASALAPNH